MTRIWIRIAVWSSLHEPVWIFRSSHGSVFEPAVYWVHSEHQSDLLLSSLDRTSESIIIVPRNHKLRERGINTHITHVCTHTCKPQCVHMHVYTHIQVYTQAHANTSYMHTHTYMYYHIITHPIYIHNTHAHTYLHNITNTRAHTLMHIMHTHK